MFSALFAFKSNDDKEISFRQIDFIESIGFGVKDDVECYYVTATSAVTGNKETIVISTRFGLLIRVFSIT